MLSRLAATCAIMVSVAGCANVLGPGAGTPTSARPADTSSAVTEEPAADVAHVVCEKDAVRLDDPVVRAHSDGVHLLIENPGAAWGVDLHHESWAHGTAEGFELNDEATPDTSAIGPSKVIVACLPTSRSSYFDPGVPTATLVIVDPDGLYVPWDLACGVGEQIRTKMSASKDEDPADVFRRVPGVRASDELRKPLYPGSPLHWPTVIVFRDGQAVGRIGAPVIGTEWELLIDACPGSGITKT